MAVYDKQWVNLEDCLNNFTKADIDKIAVDHMKTGFSGLDMALGGGISQGLTILGAIPGLGKSTIMLQIAQNAALTGTPVLVFSMEMSRNQITAKAISREIFLQNGRESAITANDILSREKVRTFKDKDWQLIKQASESIKAALGNIYVVERKSYSASAKQIADKVVSFIDENPGVKPLVIVDYLQILSGGDKILSDKQLVDESVKEMASLALTQSIPVVLISSLNRNSYKKELDMTAFKESGGIEYSSDVLMALQFSKAANGDFNIEEEKAKCPRKIELNILKQRYGQSGLKISFDYYAPYDCFVEIAEEQLKTVVRKKKAAAPKKSAKAESEKKETAPADSAVTESTESESSMVDELFSDFFNKRNK